MTSCLKVKPVVALLGAATLSLAAPAVFAETCNLTSQIGATPCALGAAIYENPDNSVIVGSGVVNPFLTVQQNGTESGFSTDALTNNLPLNVKRAEGNGQFTRTFSTSDLGTVVRNGITYYQFFLDINEPSGGASSLLSLDLLKIYNAGNVGSINLGTGTTFTTLENLYGPALYSLGSDNVLLNYDVFGKGSGAGIDMDVLINASLFQGAGRLVFATAFGGSAASGDGYEEWWYRAGSVPDTCPPGTTGDPPFCVPVSQVPEPGSLALLGLGLMSFVAVRRRRGI
ncbi:PEP-CTERM sorting domain-containing protein [Dechloromonas sp. XY25]|uniref:PEP-CTERM sorting domain-containing protein n=1 Tax=Dechloromonas hankyongensis TaxID=2908002 RepID=A0ABS9K640_9RHOO|nr:PEP-CTERM sorting domain-containing protein [Dechloromonas hankyongensis]MCG2578641.1 PEP-CTERM sorting domain-containing protein [Dechloromonas hankyongensis]